MLAVGSMGVLLLEKLFANTQLPLISNFTEIHEGKG
jgi:hypothetical protein